MGRKKEENRKRNGNSVAVAHSKRGGAGAGPHNTKRADTDRRHQKHKGSWYDDQDPEDYSEE